MAENIAMLIPAANCDAITPGDSLLANPSRAIMVGTEGNVIVDFVGHGIQITLTDLRPGVVYPLQVKKIYQPGTTSTGILVLY